MLTRVASAAVGIPVFIGLCLWGAEPFCIAVALVACLGLAEILRAMLSKGLRPSILIASIGLVAPAATIAFNHGQFGPFMVDTQVVPWITTAGMLLLTAFAAEVVRAASTGHLHVARNLAYGLICGIYVSLFAGLGTLRNCGDYVKAVGGHKLETGAALVLLVAISVWATDSCAFFVGKSIGKNKLAPKFSPHKTVEGAVGGMIGGILFGAIAGQLLMGNYRGGLLVGLIAGVLGQVGDIFESAVKREIGVKDLGTIMPGHGGALDRFDSLLFVAPVVALLLPWILPLIK